MNTEDRLREAIEDGEAVERFMNLAKLLAPK
jgi:hypothetical protein